MGEGTKEKFDLDAAHRRFFGAPADMLLDLAMAPPHFLLNGVKDALHRLEREQRSPEEIIAEKLINFDEFLVSEDSEYQEDFKTARKTGQLVFAGFTQGVHEQYGIEIVEPEEDFASIVMPNNHWLEIHRQNSGDLFLVGSVKNQD